MTVNKRSITYKADNQSWVYDASSHSASNTASKTEGTLPSGHTATFSCSGSVGAAVGTATKTLSTVVIKNSGGTDVSGSFTITKNNGTLTVSKRPINVTAGSNSKTYDGTPLTYNSVTAESTGTNRGLVSGHSMTSCTVTGSQTIYGSANNVPSGAVIKSGSTDVTSNYNISYVNGTLTINKCTITYTADNQSWPYDGTTHSASNTATKTGGTLPTGHTATFSCTGSVGAAVGTATKTLSSVTIKNSGGTDVSGSFTITKNNGTLTISKASTNAPVLVAGGTTTYTGTTYYATAANGSGNPGGTIYYGASSGASTYSMTAGTAANMTSMGRKDVGTTTIYAFFQPTDTTNYSNSGVASTTVTITNKAGGSGSVTMSGWTYGGTVTNPNPSSSTNGTSSVSYTWYNSSKTALSSKPGSTSTAGTYYVKATFAATTNYTEYTTD